VKIVPRVTLLWKDKRLNPGTTVELLDADAEHLIAEGVADAAPVEGDKPPATKPAAAAAGKK
jgi:hypothetical protein